ncbi:protein kinase, putative [Trichomonas vaginalis G3]|uniref:Protein kinase, putative n=1 Tax=Trichomonas vaginalis (strain ATCC PRA-98 / G3) TaxID=412133 RepID=A2F9J3_TRIV3|nr:protein ubiquitination [Trichomonas vaginalis G3]EAX98422.1 protein kinase, putative [Trichomonas vaginalis G3]KAI5526268.1 protein ubiquitination [Trichomonas vaginalis G3]|eukprot:XP_001311352.1 protein kinase [Trichomonas vaginalis G3]
MLDGYSNVKPICEHANTKVFIATNNLDQQLEIITQISNLNLSEIDIKSFKANFNILSKLSHPAISIPYKFKILQNSLSTIFLFAKTNTTKTMDDYLVNVTQNEYNPEMSILFSAGVISAITYLHSNNIVCNDITFDSILIDENLFPIFSSIGTYFLLPSLGPPSDLHDSVFVAPELQTIYAPNFMTDMFSLSMVICRFFSQGYKFKPSHKSGSIGFKLLNGFRPIFDVRAPLFIQSIMESCWTQEPQRRPSANQVQRLFLSGCQFYSSIQNSEIITNYFDVLKEFLNVSRIDTIIPVIDCQLLDNYGKNRAIHFIKLQDYILSVTKKNYDDTLKSISEFLKLHHNRKHIISIIWIAANVRYKKLNLLAKLLKDIMELNSKFDKLPEEIFEKSFLEIAKYNPLPAMKSRIAFIRELYWIDLIQKQRIIEEIKNLFNNEDSQVNSLLPFCWFADIVHSDDIALYNQVISFIESHLHDDFFPKVYLNFYKNIEFYSKDNWSFYNDILKLGNTDDELLNAIKKDDTVSFGKFAKSFQKPLKVQIPINVFERCPLIKDDIFIQLYSMVYGSMKIYHQFSINKCQVGADKEYRKSAQYAAAIGCEPIYSSVILTKVKMDESVHTAAEFHQNDLFEFIIYGNNEFMRINKDGRLTLTVAAGANNIYVLLKCINLGQSVNSTEVFGRTALHAAAFNGAVESLSILLSMSEIDVNRKDNFGETPFYLACERGNFFSVKQFLSDKRVDVNAANEDGKTPLMAAAESGNLELIKLLLKTKAIDQNLQMENGQTAFHCAASYDLKAFEFMVRNGNYDNSIVDRKGRTAIDIAIKNGFDSSVIESYCRI